jgi:hypothetical protein
MRNYSIKTEPRDHVYRSLFSLALKWCDTFILVMANERLLHASGRDTLHRLQPFLIARTQESEWPGTKLVGPTATVSRFKLCDETVAILGSVCSGLYDWVEPQLPEDPCMFRADGTPWLVTIAHERDAYMPLSEAERRVVRDHLPGLALADEPDE